MPINIISSFVISVDAMNWPEFHGQLSCNRPYVRIIQHYIEAYFLTMFLTGKKFKRSDVLFLTAQKRGSEINTRLIYTYNDIYFINQYKKNFIHQYKKKNSFQCLSIFKDLRKTWCGKNCSVKKTFFLIEIFMQSQTQTDETLTQAYIYIHLQRMMEDFSCMLPKSSQTLILRKVSKSLHYVVNLSTTIHFEGTFQK